MKKIETCKYSPPKEIYAALYGVLVSKCQLPKLKIGFKPPVVVDQFNCSTCKLWRKRQNG